MKDIVIIGLAMIIIFLLWNGRKMDGYVAPVVGDASQEPASEQVPPDVTQVILDSVQQKNPDFIPIETLFINKQGDNMYTARFMFFNTRHYYGVQYDVKAKVESTDKVEILSQKETTTADYSGAYKPDEYTPYSDISASLDSQLKYALSKPLTTPPLEAYKPALGGR